MCCAQVKRGESLAVSQHQQSLDFLIPLTVARDVDRKSKKRFKLIKKKEIISRHLESCNKCINFYIYLHASDRDRIILRIEMRSYLAYDGAVYKVNEPSDLHTLPKGDGIKKKGINQDII